MKKLNFFVLIIFLFILIGFYYYSVNFRQQNNSAIAMYSSGYYKKTSEMLKVLVDNKKDNIVLKFNYAASMYKNFDYDKAIEIYNNLLINSKILDDITKSEIYYNLGNAFFLKDEYEIALDNYKTALILNPNDDETRYNIEYIVDLIRIVNNPDELMYFSEKTFKEQAVFIKEKEKTLNEKIKEAIEQKKNVASKNKELSKRLNNLSKQSKESLKKEIQNLLKEKESVQKYQKLLQQKQLAQ